MYTVSGEKGGRSLELLYLVDRSLTNALQAVSRVLERRLALPRALQPIFVMIPFLGLSLGFQALFQFDPNGTPLGVLLVLGYVFLLMFSSLIGWVFGIVLELVHSRVDPERFFAHKDFSCGHIAWGHMILAAVSLSLALIDRHNPFVSYTCNLGFFALVPNAYREFINRYKFHNDTKKQGVTEAMKKLLERCRSWLPKPTPVPS